MITVLGRRNSANVQKVMWTLGELGLEYHREDVGGSFGFPENYASPNPVVPSIIDAGLTIWESNACVRYLARTYGEGTLWPTDRAELATAEMWMEWQRSEPLNSFFLMFQMMVRDLPGTPERLQRAKAACVEAFTTLDRQLQGRSFICGDNLTMADIVIGAVCYRYMSLPIERASLPAMEAWYQQLVERPAYQKHVMIEYGSNIDEWNAHEKANAGVQ